MEDSYLFVFCGPVVDVFTKFYYKETIDLKKKHDRKFQRKCLCQPEGTGVQTGEWTLGVQVSVS